jgi:hypothetical protein
MVATLRPQSSAGKPHEPPFPGLDEGSFEPGPRDIELEDRLTVDLDRSLADEGS